jgi:FkbH-like protein
MAEPVRLVIWDLDETFWHGTLTEGGIAYNQSAHDVVIELARRGIMNSICSKNDLANVKSILCEHGIWDYFVFPSINWQPKGPRIKSLIETVQLRPESVMLIDDNPMNLNEAAFFSPGLQISDETIISQIASHPLFRGKNDSGMTRLQQYKLLEKRKNDELLAGGNNLEFLRSSRIRVGIESNIDPHIDRAIELINRTNQLNFTKQRLPEEQEAARAELRELLSHFDVVAGLIRVEDNYGDYGFCGFFATQLFEGVHKRLIHFCFSCRILGMGVEAYVYRTLLDRPALAVRGEVLSDPLGAEQVDWIEKLPCDVEQSQSDVASIASGSISLRGGCDLAIVEHYARMAFSEVRSEYNLSRNGISLRCDHSVITRYSIETPPAAAFSAIHALGYEPSDFQSALFSDPRPGVWILSCIPDTWVPVYRHNSTGALVPFTFDPKNGLANACELSNEQFRSITDNPHLISAIEEISSKFTYVGLIPEVSFKTNLAAIINAIPQDSQIFLILNKEYYGATDSPETAARPTINVNRWTREIAAQFRYVYPILMTDFVVDASEIHEDNHFHRMVYFRMFEHIKQSVSTRSSVKGAPEPAVVESL